MYTTILDNQQYDYMSQTKHSCKVSHKSRQLDGFCHRKPQNLRHGLAYMKDLTDSPFLEKNNNAKPITIRLQNNYDMTTHRNK